MIALLRNYANAMIRCSWTWTLFNWAFSYWWLNNEHRGRSSIESQNAILLRILYILRSDTTTFRYSCWCESRIEDALLLLFTYILFVIPADQTITTTINIINHSWCEMDFLVIKQTCVWCVCARAAVVSQAQYARGRNRLSYNSNSNSIQKKRKSYYNRFNVWTKIINILQSKLNVCRVARQWINYGEPWADIFLRARTYCVVLRCWLSTVHRD